MDNPPVITALGLTKSYRIWKEPAQRLLGPILAEAASWMPGPIGGALQRKAHSAYRDFYALQDVSFEVRRGEAVGIVGRNGAGKSTLLQLIAGTLQPTSGTIEVKGRVAALLELGAGFNPEFTGRENVFLSGAVLGLSKAEVERRFDDIAAFADIGEFIEQPVKTYSSGMMMRLAFAVNTCVDPEILIVDEALSVGDAPFQSKCFRRLRQLIDGGVSLLFVSHDLGTVRSICSRALWLKQGRAEMWGEAKTVAKEYEKYCWSEQGVQVSGPYEETPATPPKETSTSKDNPEIPAALLLPNDQFTRAAGLERWGTGVVRIQNAIVVDAGREPTTDFDYDSPAEAWFLLEVNQAVASDCILGVRFSDLRGNTVLAFQDLHETLSIRGSTGDRYAARISLRLPLHHSDYTMRVAIFGYKDGVLKTGQAYDFGDAIIWDVIENCAVVRVRPCTRFPLSGPVHMHGATLLLQLSKAVN